MVVNSSSSFQFRCPPRTDSCRVVVCRPASGVWDKATSREHRYHQRLGIRPVVIDILFQTVTHEGELALMPSMLVFVRDTTGGVWVAVGGGAVVDHPCDCGLAFQRFATGLKVDCRGYTEQGRDHFLLPISRTRNRIAVVRISFLQWLQAFSAAPRFPFVLFASARFSRAIAYCARETLSQQ